MIQKVNPEHLNLTKEDEERLSILFDRLDVNKDGKIDVKDLTEALHEMDVPKHPGHTQVKCLKHFHFTEIATTLKIVCQQITFLLYCLTVGYSDLSRLNTYTGKQTSDFLTFRVGITPCPVPVACHHDHAIIIHASAISWSG